MAESGALTSFGGKRYCGDRKFAESKVFAVSGVESEFVAESGPLASFGGKRYCGDRKFTGLKVFAEGGIEGEYVA